MANALYPIGVIERLDVTRFDRALIDEFEDGSTSARRLWAAASFKRKFEIQHALITQREYDALRGFYSQRDGRAEHFWFRDNVGREGNAKVRFAQPLQSNRIGALYAVRTELHEVAPVRALPSVEELTAAAGVAPLYWYDANREVYFEHVGTVYTQAALHDAMGAGYDAAWTGGALDLGDTTDQWQHLNFASGLYAKSAATVSLTGTQPALTVFTICRHSASAAAQVVCGLGSQAGFHGISLDATGYYRARIGATETTMGKQNSAVDTWRSLACAWTASSNDVQLWGNAVSVGTEALARTWGNGSALVAALPDGTLPLNPAGTMAHAEVGHVIVFAATLATAKVEDVHNLLAHQFGMAVV